MRKITLSFVILLIVVFLAAGVRLDAAYQESLYHPEAAETTGASADLSSAEVPFTDSQATVKLPGETFLTVTDFAPPNNELQSYVPGQVSIDGGRIEITAQKSGNSYVSGMAVTKMAFQYGTFAFRVNTIKGRGLFPAIWMLPANHEPLPEIDIYEHLGSSYDRFYGVLHTRDANDTLQKQSFMEFLDEVELPPFCVIQFRWTPDELVWYLNGRHINTFTENVPQQPMYLIFNLAVGGNWPGDPTPETVFPSQFIVDILQFEPENISIR